MLKSSAFSECDLLLLGTCLMYVPMSIVLVVLVAICGLFCCSMARALLAFVKYHISNHLCFYPVLPTVGLLPTYVPYWVNWVNWVKNGIRKNKIAGWAETMDLRFRPTPNWVNWVSFYRFTQFLQSFTLPKLGKSATPSSRSCFCRLTIGGDCCGLQA